MNTHPETQLPVYPTQIDLPPHARGRTALGMTAAAARGEFMLQQCSDCGAVQYPPRQACHRCLGAELPWQRQAQGAVLVSQTVLHHSNARYFRHRLPWHVGLARLDCGPTVMLHLPAPLPEAARLRVDMRLDRAGSAILIGLPEEEATEMKDSALMRELGCDPRGRTILVTDAQSLAGRAIVTALTQAGAARIWAGCPVIVDPLRQNAVAQAVRLDLRDVGSLRAAAAAIGEELDIVINTATLQAPARVANLMDRNDASAEMDINYFGLLRLAEVFSPLLRQRSSAQPQHMPAWVNLLSIGALASLPGQASYCASQAAAHCFSQGLRADLSGAGVRVMNLFPGPLEDDSPAQSPGIRVAPAVLARALLQGLRSGLEDVYPGELAQDWVSRWRADPKVFEREVNRPPG
ncbi:SDR family NAD(P)-dependent oxidoreductase [Herbaspirillum frisingense]|uniref:SDR family NAD(P)-dependent oxidoreductase n=1 Tax=Herbaspirillum frisingense TaxID=92645 RepID=UPI0016004777|nr:SDR family NAD(P)-dependent oxidoreductase [Herbaspirillum frisingense]QNB09448.1 SDR family NAD(P)-dependent oxidoreductase [Herbaspirillum frisingense]